MAKRRYEADYVLNLNKTISSLQSAKKQAEAFDDIMAQIGDRGNFNELIKHFLNLDSAVDDLRQSTNELMSELGESLKGGYISSLDSVFNKLAEISKKTHSLFSGINNIDIGSENAGKQLVQYATELNEVFASLNVKNKINIKNFSTKPIEEQFKRLVKAASILNTEINTSLGNINVGQIGAEIGDSFGRAGFALEDFSEDVQKAIKKLQDQNDALLEVQNALKKTAKLVSDVKSKGNSAIPDDFKLAGEDLKVDKIIGLMDQYDALDEQMKSGKLSTEDYTESLIRLTEITLTLQSVLAKVRSNDKLKNIFSTLPGGTRGGNFLGAISTYAHVKSEGLFSKVSTSAEKDVIGQLMLANDQKIEQIKQDAIKSFNAGSGGNKDLEETVSLYGELTKKVKEYHNAVQTVNNENASVEEVDMAYEKMEEVVNDIVELTNATDTQQRSIQALLGTFEKEATFSSVLEELCTTLGVEIPQAIDTVAGSIKSVGDMSDGYIINPDQLKNDLEQIHDLALKTGKELSFSIEADGVKYVVESIEGVVKASDEAATAVHSLSGNLTTLAHTHPSGNGYFSAGDFLSALNAKSVGVNSPVMALGKDMASVLNLDGVTDDVIAQVRAKLGTLSGDAIITPKLFKEITQIFEAGGFSDALKTISVSEGMEDLAAFLQKIGANAAESINPLEKFQSLIMYYSNGKVNKGNLSSFSNYWDDFTSGAKSAVEVFDAVMDKIGATDLDGNPLKINTDGYRSLEVATKNITVGTSGVVNQIEESVEDASIKLQAFYDLVDEVNKKSFYSSEDNVEIGKYIERLTLAKQELDSLGEQGKITADELEAVKTAFNNSINSLGDQTSTYTGYGNGHYFSSYQEEYFEADQERKDLKTINDELKEKNELLERSNDLLKEEAAKKQELLDATIAEKQATEEALSQERYLSNELGQRVFNEEFRADKEKERADALERQNAELQEQLAIQQQQQIISQNNVNTQEQLFETSSGQLSMFGSVADELQRAESNAEELKDTVKEIAILDGQISFDELAESNKYGTNFNDGGGGPGRGGPGGDYALENTLQTTNSILTSIEGKISTSDSNKNQSSKLDVDSLSAAVLKKAAVFGNEIQLGSFTKTKDGFNQVAGAFKDANGIWKGFTARVNESNEVVKIGIQKQSAFADALNGVNKETKETTQKVKQSDEHKSIASRMATSIAGEQTQYNKKIADNIGSFDNSTVVIAKLNEYQGELNELKRIHKELAAAENLSEQEILQKKEAFDIAKGQCEKYRQELVKLIKDSNTFSSNHSDVRDDFNGFNLVDPSEQEKALRSYIASVHGGKAVIGSFDEANKELAFTLKDGEGKVKQMAASFDVSMTKIGTSIKKPKEAASMLGSIFSDIGSKFKSLWVYASARFGVDEIFQQVRNGVQAVRDIDSALTELKKVTDETDASYQAFLSNMSKTAGVVGSTVKDLTTMSADWARLGYSMEEAGKLAESTAILLNVSEFNDATEASEALISTMQAFSYVPEESQHVVDILNEVGKFIARR